MKSRALNTLSAVYLLSASAFGVAIAWKHTPSLAKAAHRAGETAWSAIRRSANVLDEWIMGPADKQFAVLEGTIVDIESPPSRVTRKHRRLAQHARTHSAIAQRPPMLRSAIEESRRVVKTVEAPSKPAMKLIPSQELPAQTVTGNIRDIDVSPGPVELTRVMLRLKNSLTEEMLQNFELFLYVSKAESGPLAQRMYVFKKRGDGDLRLLYNWPVSTGREAVEFAPNGRIAPSYTPQGYYELDPGRMYRHHVSGQWHTPMPYAMFFNWQVKGLQTGLAIHSATGEDVALLGKRASAGCVRLAPQNAALLFDLIRTHYKGLAPRFAVDRSTATMSNQGLLMHDEQGAVKMSDGYKVLVFIENYGGNNLVAAVF